MGLPYTDSAAEAVRLAGRAAAQLQQQRIGTEHLLLGLIREEKGTAHVVLEEFHVDEKRTLELVEKLADGAGESGVPGSGE